MLQNTTVTNTPPLNFQKDQTHISITFLARSLANNALIERVYYAKSTHPLLIDRIFNDGISRKEGKGMDGSKNLFMAPPDLARAFVRNVDTPYKDILVQIHTYLQEFHTKMLGVTFQKEALQNLWTKFDGVWNVYKAMTLPEEPNAQDMISFVNSYNQYLVFYLRNHDKMSAIRDNAQMIADASVQKRAAALLPALTREERAVLYAVYQKLPITSEMEPYLKSLESRLYVYGDTVLVHMTSNVGAQSYGNLFKTPTSGNLSLFDAANPSTISPEDVESCLGSLFEDAEDSFDVVDTPKSVDTDSVSASEDTRSRQDIVIDYWLAYMTSVLERADKSWSKSNPTVSINAPLWEHPTRATSVKRFFEDLGLIIPSRVGRGLLYNVKGTDAFFDMPKTREALVSYVLSYTPTVGSVYQEFLDVIERHTQGEIHGKILTSKTLIKDLQHRQITQVYDLDNWRTVALLRGDLDCVEQEVKGVFIYKAPSKSTVPTEDSEKMFKPDPASMDAKGTPPVPVSVPAPVKRDDSKMRDLQKNTALSVLGLLKGSTSESVVSFKDLSLRLTPILGSPDIVWDSFMSLVL